MRIFRTLQLVTLLAVASLAAACTPAASDNPFRGGDIYKGILPTHATGQSSDNVNTLSGGELQYR